MRNLCGELLAKIFEISVGFWITESKEVTRAKTERAPEQKILSTKSEIRNNFK